MNTRLPLTGIPALLLACACAGPTTPLGPLNTLPNQAQESLRTLASSYEESFFALNGPEMQFEPKRQVLHEPTPWRIRISDSKLDPKQPIEIQVRYNGFDVTRSFLKRSKLTADAQGWWIESPKLRLLPNAKHRIEITYQSPSGQKAIGVFSGPVCRALDDQPVLQTARYKPDPELLSYLSKITREAGMNPSFVAALIAQESGFKPHAVSWAKAIGLTQIGPLAEIEVAKLYDEWPRSTELSSLPMPAIEAMILSGKLNAQNDWRLDPQKSIQGGLAYLEILMDRLNRPEIQNKIRFHFADPEVALTRLLAASYHSGITRVLDALQRRGPAWLEDESLGVARYYVNRIDSFCDHFGGA